jgi:phage protein D
VTLRTPIIRIVGPSGFNIIPKLGPAFLGATISDQEGYESDQLTIRVTARAPFLEPPAKGARYRVFAGWLAGSVRMLGVYEYQSTLISGSPEDGEEMQITARSADFIDKAKGGDRRHYDEENGYGTAGKIFDQLASEMGVAAVIPPELREIKIPYRLRWNQSAIDFATELADEIGAITKPQAGRLVVRKRGAGASASGRSLPAITVHHDPSYAYEFNLEPRPGYQEVETPWFDAAKGITRLAKAAQGKAASLSTFMHPFASEAEAEIGGKATAQQLARNTGSGFIEIAGNADVMAGSPIVPEGYGSAVSAIDWEASGVEHEFTPEPGWITRIDLQAKEEG